MVMKTAVIKTSYHQGYKKTHVGEGGISSTGAFHSTVIIEKVAVNDT